MTWTASSRCCCAISAAATAFAFWIVRAAPAARKRGPFTRYTARLPNRARTIRATNTPLRILQPLRVRTQAWALDGARARAPAPRFFKARRLSGLCRIAQIVKEYIAR